MKPLEQDIIKSRERVRDHGEVLTPKRVVMELSSIYWLLNVLPCVSNTRTQDTMGKQSTWKIVAQYQFLRLH